MEYHLVVVGEKYRITVNRTFTGCDCEDDFSKNLPAGTVVTVVSKVQVDGGTSPSSTGWRSVLCSVLAADVGIKVASKYATVEALMSSSRLAPLKGDAS